ncbi:tetratricopeptide repeat protein [Streptomyces sp. NPDC056747]|uniref:tetratricopeptide repeat protein n=1 Tax=Streptomyces sp. NPDC056747 TaxID=3345935 RepID=UPI00369F597F
MAGERASRRVLVIGSQCDAQNTLGFLPELAHDLADVLTAPQLGDCTSALESGPTLLDPTRTTMVGAIDEAFRNAAATESTLVLALIGHGISSGEDFYFLPVDGTARCRSDEDVLLSQLLKEQLRDAPRLDGLLVLLDTCHAGVGAAQAGAWREVGLGRHLRRYEILTASADEPAFGGKVTKCLIDVVRRGVATAGTTVDSRYLREPLLEAAGHQRPQRITHDGGDWAEAGDEGLWWAHNAARALVGTEESDDAAFAVLDRVTELTGHFQPTPVLEELVAAAGSSTRVALVGPRGSGKSTLAAALALQPDDFLHGIAFCVRSSTVASVAHSLAAQLRVTVPGFAEAARDYRARLSSAEREGFDALEQHVLGPLATARHPFPVRLVIDALDELPTATRSVLVRALNAADPHVHVVTTGRPASLRVTGSRLVVADPSGPDAIEAYARGRGVQEANVPFVVRQADGNWLLAHLLTDSALRPGYSPAAPGDDTTAALRALYEGELIAAGADDPAQWRTAIRPVIGALSVAAAGPNVPLPLLVAASRHLHGPGTVTQVRDILVRLSGLVVRTQPGQPAEHVGLFHASLAEDYLLRPGDGQFDIDPSDCHAAMVAAIDECAPLTRHDPRSPLHRYALRSEARHRWYASHDATAVVSSLLGRPADTVVDERERWQPWPAAFAEVLGPEHPDTLNVRVSLARWTGLGGDAAAASDQCAELLPILERVLGARHRSTLVLVSYFIHWTEEAGNPPFPPDDHAELLSLFTEVLGAEHPDTLAIAVGVARSTGSDGNASSARDQCASLLPVFERVLGPEHRHTLTLRSHLAKWTAVAGDRDAALELCRELIPDLERVLGEDDQVTLACWDHVADWIGESGDPVNARDLCGELVGVRERVLGPDHPDTLQARASLARWVGAAGDPASERDMDAQLLSLTMRVLGPEHPLTLTVRCNLAGATARAGDPAAARTQQAEVLKVLERLWGPEHPDTLALRANLAGTTGRSGDATSARDQCTALKPAFERVLGPEHPRTLFLRAELSSWTGAAGDAPAAARQCAELLPLAERVLGADHAASVAVRHNLDTWRSRARPRLRRRERSLP